jgi:predicted DNA binding CopG/RHH family protein
MKKYLDEEEAEILQLHKNQRLVVSEARNEEITKATKSAKNALKKNAVLNIKLSDSDLNNLKLKEIETGVPYQKIVSALIHNYLENKIKITL